MLPSPPCETVYGILSPAFIAFTDFAINSKSEVQNTILEGHSAATEDSLGKGHLIILWFMMFSATVWYVAMCMQAHWAAMPAL